jgi:hypothetical protein
MDVVADAEGTPTTVPAQRCMPTTADLLKINNREGINGINRSDRMHQQSFPSFTIIAEVIY